MLDNKESSPVLLRIADVPIDVMLTVVVATMVDGNCTEVELSAKVEEKLVEMELIGVVDSSDVVGEPESVTLVG